MHGVITCFSAIPAPDAAKKLLKDVVGALRIYGDRSGWSIDGYGIGKEPVAIFVDLLTHLVAQMVGRQFGVLFEFPAKLLHALADGGHGPGLAFIV